MNKPKILKKIIPEQRILRHINEFNNSDKRHPGTMNTADPGKYMHAYDDLISEVLKTKVTAVSGNYYKHDIPYMPHTDYKSHLGNCVNAVIPLSYTKNQPRFIIFDQMWKYESVTWCMHYDVKVFGRYCGVNTGVKGCPHEYDVEYLTNKEIDDNLYNDHLSHLKKEDLFGMSGTVTYFEPRDIILFNNQNIHCTSSINGVKLGLSLRFKYG